MDTYPQSPATSHTSRKEFWLHRCLFLFFVFVLPLAYLFHQALLDRGSSLLPLEKEARWVFHPVQTIEEAFRKPATQAVTFQLRFWQEETPPTQESCVLKLRAFRSLTEVRLNGKEVFKEAPKFWQEAFSVELSPVLKQGENYLELVVANPEGIPGLMVEEPAILRTPGDWTASLKHGPPKPRAVVPAKQYGPPEPLDQRVGKDPGPLTSWLRANRLSFLTSVWLILWGGLTFAAVIHLFRGRLIETEGETFCPENYAVIAGVLILGLGLFLGLGNASTFPPERSPFDFHQHVEYINYVSHVGLVPNPTEGFQMYQPPLYYWLAAWVRGEAVESLKPVQFIGALAGWILVLITWLLTRRLLPGQPISHVLALLFVVCLPMSIYMSPLVTNEVFAAAMIAVAFWWLIRTSEDSGSTWNCALAGVLVGLAMLSKFSAVFVLLAGCAWFTQQFLLERNSRSLRRLLLYTGPALLVCGWFYARNLFYFGHPFVKAGDAVSGFWYVQQPSYRTFEFYCSFGSVFFHHPERAPWISFADGHYASFWGDLFRVFLDAGDETAFFLLSLLLLLAFPASGAILLGLLRSLRSCWKRPWGNPDLLMLSVPVWTLLALIFFSIELPFVSVIKAFFFLFLTPVLAFHFVRGRVLFYRFFRPLGWFHDSSFLLVCGISLWLYSFPAS